MVGKEKGQKEKNLPFTISLPKCQSGVLLKSCVQSSIWVSDGGAQVLGPSSAAFQNELAESWIRSRVGDT